MEADLRSFLIGVGEQELLDRGVLQGVHHWLVEESVPALVSLMRERGVTRLTSGNGWWFDDTEQFNNPDGDNRFTYQNVRYNPFYIRRV